MKKAQLFILFIIMTLTLFIPLITFREAITTRYSGGGSSTGTTSTGTTSGSTTTTTATASAGSTGTNTQDLKEVCKGYKTANPDPLSSSIIGSGLAGSAGSAGSNTTGTSIPPTGTDSSYSYIRFIKSPSQMGMSGKGTLETLDKDIKGLVSYVKLLVEGKSSASKSTNGGPLGNKFFVKTLGKCKDPAGVVQDRYFYVNNVPLGNIPMLGSEEGTNFKDFRGLIPGMLQNLDVLNPENIASAFLTESVPKCTNITMETIDSNNVVSTATHFVTLSDIAELDPCLFPSVDGKRKNPQTGAQCNMEGFTSNGNQYDDSDSDSDSEKTEEEKDIIQEDIKTDYISQVFLGSVGLFGVYLFYLAMKRSKTRL